MLIILVIGISSTYTHDFKRLVGIGSNAHVLVGNFLTSSVQNMSKDISFQEVELIRFYGYQCRTSIEFFQSSQQRKLKNLRKEMIDLLNLE